MSDYDDLYNGTPPHQAHSETSTAAAKEIVKDARSIRFRVYSKIKMSGARGLTDEEVQMAMGLQLQTEVPRRRELVMKGLVVDGGMKRMTVSRRWATVWVVAGSFVEPEEVKRSTAEQLREARAEVRRLKIEIARLNRLICVTGNH